MKQMPLTLKGTREGIHLKPQAENWEEVINALKLALEDAEEFFRGGRVILELGSRGLTKGELLSLRTVLDQYDIELNAVLSEDENAIRTARSYGIRTRLPKRTESPAAAPENTANDAIFVQRTLRSGQNITFPGHITILGDINPGAEVVAGGNVIVWGKVRGLVHAGALGDESVTICALELAPTQLRIAGLVSRAPEERRHRKPKPEMAKVNRGCIVAEPWTTRG